ncbi:MAG TPA: hypothetical protein VGD41_06695 [Pyrinomonadaceae bacterium]
MPNRIGDAPYPLVKEAAIGARRSDAPILFGMASAKEAGAPLGVK